MNDAASAAAAAAISAVMPAGNVPEQGIVAALSGPGTLKIEWPNADGKNVLKHEFGIACPSGPTLATLICAATAGAGIYILSKAILEKEEKGNGAENVQQPSKPQEKAPLLSSKSKKMLSGAAMVAAGLVGTILLGKK
jgi:hypothetical protein